MAMRLYAHPFSSYSQKALIALYENGTSFEYRALEGPDSEAMRELGALWPMRRFPVLVDGDRTVFEASCVIEYLDLWHSGPTRLVPADPRAALEVRMLDRFFDNYVSTPQQKVVFDRLRPEAVRDVHGVLEARAMLDIAYAWLEHWMRGRTWASGEAFSMELAELILIIVVIGRTEHDPTDSTLSHESVFPLGRFGSGAFRLVESAEMLLDNVIDGITFA